MKCIYEFIYRVPIHKWDEAEWKQHTKYLKKLAKPKKEPKQPKLVIVNLNSNMFLI